MNLNLQLEIVITPTHLCDANSVFWLHNSVPVIGMNQLPSDKIEGASATNLNHLEKSCQIRLRAIYFCEADRQPSKLFPLGRLQVPKTLEKKENPKISNLA